MNGKVNKHALKKALKMTVFILIAFEAAAFLVQTVSEAGRYLRMDIGNPVHQAIFAAVAVAVGGYTYFRECMKEKTSQEDDSKEEESVSEGTRH